MATGQIIGTPYRDANSAYASVMVAEGGVRGNVEYSVSTPLLDGAGNAKSGATLKSDLVAAVTALRNAQTATTTAVAGITGTVTV